VLMELWRQYMEEEYPKSRPRLVAIEEDSPLFRVVPINEKSKRKAQVLAYEDAARIVENASVIAVTNCPLPDDHAQVRQTIDVLLQITRASNIALKRAPVAGLMPKEAKTILRRAEASRSGPSHGKQSRYRDGHPAIACNCLFASACPMQERRHQRPARSQPLRAVVDENACTGCG